MTGNKIYNLSSGTLEVYSLIPNTLAIINARHEEMTKIPDDEKVLIRKDTTYFLPKDVVYKNPNYILCKNQSKENYKILNNFYQGELSHFDVFKKIDINDNDLYLLDIQSAFNYEYDNRYLKLTKLLYYIHLIALNDWSNKDLLTEDLKPYIKYFYLSDSPISCFNMDIVKKFYNSGLINQSYEALEKKVEESSKIYQKIKRF